MKEFITSSNEVFTDIQSAILEDTETPGKLTWKAVKCNIPVQYKAGS
jgi:hypothetical protein